MRGRREKGGRNRGTQDIVGYASEPSTTSAVACVGILTSPQYVPMWLNKNKYFKITKKKYKNEIMNEVFTNNYICFDVFSGVLPKIMIL